jgi:2'-5' RNA ligase
VRLFFAVVPDPKVAGEINALASAHDYELGSRRTTPKTYHLTLAYLGKTTPERLPALRRFAAEQNAIKSEICFSVVEHWAAARVLVVAAPEIGDSLRRLSLELSSQRQDGGQIEHHWRPHVTLARNVSQAPVLQAMSPICWMPTEFVLMESVLAPGGAVYTVVDTWPLLDKNDARAKSR